MQSKRRFVAAAVLWGFVSAPAPVFAGPLGAYDQFPDRSDHRRPPRPSEHLGDYLIAEKLPPRYPLPPESQRPSQPTSEPIAAVLKSRGFPTPPTLDKFGPLGAGPPKAGTNGRTSIHFSGPSGMKVTWQLPNGSFNAEANAPTAPKEYNFVQGQTYRLRLTRVTKDAPNETFYPTMEIAAATPKTRTFLAHSSVPVMFTADEFAQAKAGTLVVKVLYLPDPAHQDFSTVVGAEEVVSTRLEPGTDPVAEAERRGTILAVIRLDNIDLKDRSRPRSEER